MKCKHCGLPIQKNDKICPHCTRKTTSKWKFAIISLIAVFLVAGISFGLFFINHDAADQTTNHEQNEIEQVHPVEEDEKENDGQQNEHQEVDKDSVETNENANQTEDEEKDEDTNDRNTSNEQTESEDDSTTQNETNKENDSTNEDQQVDSDEQDTDSKDKDDTPSFIEEAKRSVYTINTPEMQGSGFLYDWNGAIVTNAHVMEGWTEASVTSFDGKEYTGYLIGYSSETDIAVVHVPDLKGSKPYPHDTSTSLELGSEIFTIGSPDGKANSVTKGFVTGISRQFTIGSFVYKNLYQISSPIEPGSSGGPLLSIQSGKIVAVNSAKSRINPSLGFSIPLHQVASLIQSWIDSPMTQSELFDQFYRNDPEDEEVDVEKENDEQETEEDQETTEDSESDQTNEQDKDDADNEVTDEQDEDNEKEDENTEQEEENTNDEESLEDVDQEDSDENVDKDQDEADEEDQNEDGINKEDDDAHEADEDRTEDDETDMEDEQGENEDATEDEKEEDTTKENDEPILEAIRYFPPFHAQQQLARKIIPDFFLKLGGLT